VASGPDRRYQGQQPQGAWSDSRRLSPPVLPPQWRQPGFSPSGPQAAGPALGPWPPLSAPPPSAQPPSAQPAFQQAPFPGPPSQRPPRRRLGKRSIIALALGGLAVIGLTATALGSGGDPSATAAAARSAASASASAKVVREELACAERPPGSGRVYVRTVAPGGSPQVKRLSGDRRWDSASSQCLTSLQLALAAAVPGAGYCTQVGYVTDNPGYDLKATPAPPLAHVAAHAGSACRSVKAAIATQVAPAASPPPAPAHTHSAPAHTVPAATPPAATAPAYTPPAATAPAVPPSTVAAPAACTPKTNGGNCYEPGEFCRASDHGVSGIAGDGEAITCTDNDGWRWEPV
jgi:hypothetical protein